MYKERVTFKNAYINFFHLSISHYKEACLFLFFDVGPKAAALRTVSLRAVFTASGVEAKRVHE